MLYICSVTNGTLKIYNMYNQKVIQILAKTRVRFEAKLGNVITLEEAIAFETKKVTRLQKEDNSRY